MSWPEAISLMCVVLVVGVTTCVSMIANIAGKSKDNSDISED